MSECCGWHGEEVPGSFLQIHGFTVRDGPVRCVPGLLQEELVVGWYRSDRHSGPGHFEARWTVGAERGPAAPGSLEQFLVERYLLYSRAAGPLLWRGRVRHEPWLLYDARLESSREDLSTAAGLPPLGRPDLCQWSPGVAVAFEPFRPG